jgi:hypothetical protein
MGDPENKIKKVKKVLSVALNTNKQILDDLQWDLQNDDYNFIFICL